MKFKFKYFRTGYIRSFCLYILPIVLLLVLLVCSLTDFMVEATERLVEYKLNNASNIIDSNIDLLNNIAIELSENEILDKNPRDNDIYAQMQITRELKRHIGKNDFCSEIMFYFGDGNFVYTKDAVEKKDSFFNDRYGLSYERDIDKRFNSMLEPELILLDVDSEYRVKSQSELLYVVPIYNRKTIATIIFVLRHNWLEKQFEDFCEMYGGQVVVECVEDEKTITFGESIEKYDESDIESVVVTSENIGLKITGVCSKQVVFSSIRRIYCIVIFYTIGLLIIGLILVYKITNISYKPVLDIGRMIGKDFNDSEDEIELICSSINDMKIRNEQLQDGLRNREEKLKRIVLKNMLDLKDYDHDSYMSLLDDFDENGFLMKQMVVFFVSETDYKLSKDIFEGKSDLIVSEIKTEYKNATVFFIRCNEEIINGIKNIFQDIVINFKREKDISLDVIEGEIVDSIFEIKDSFASAHNIYSLQNVKNVTMLDDVGVWREYPIDLLMQFENNIERNKIEEAIVTLECLKVYVSDISLHLFEKKCIVIEVLNIFIRNIYSTENGAKEISLLQHLIEGRGPLDINNVNEIFNVFVIYMRKILDEKKYKENSDLVQACCKYINEHFYEYELSVQNITEMFSISPTFLNQKMKEEIDMNVYEYITFIRMENAIYMLLNTDLPVKTIVSLIGYYDVSSFGRKFKNMYGDSPAEYRKKNKKSH